jgi:hypothetical protein
MKYKDHQLLENAYDSVFENVTKKELLEEQKDITEEGLWDRVKGTASGLKKGVNWGYDKALDKIKGETESPWSDVGKDFTKGFKGGRTSTVIRSHVEKLNSQIDDFIEDLKKIGGTTETTEIVDLKNWTNFLFHTLFFYRKNMHYSDIYIQKCKVI